MKKLVLPLVIIVLLFWIFSDKCNSVDETIFQAKIDSTNRIIDSLNGSLIKKDSAIDELYRIDADLNYQVLYQKGKTQKIIEYVKVEKDKISIYDKSQLVSHFNRLYPQDTITNLLPVAQPVLVSAAKDLVELDGAKQQLVVKDSVIALEEERIATKDATIGIFKSKEFDYRSIISLKDDQIKDYKTHYDMLKFENNKLKFKSKITKIGSFVVIGGLTFLLISK
jgi:hypothetical protein